MDPKIDKLVRRTTMIATATTSYFLLTADNGPEPSFLDPVKNALLSAEQSVKGLVFGVKKETPQSETKKPSSTAPEKHP